MKYFFVIGTQKTGTSFLARLLDSQPQVSCMYESYLLQPKSTLSVLADGGSRHTMHGFDDAEQRERWRRRLLAVLVPEDGQRIPKRRRQRVVGEVMREVLDDFANRTGASVIGDKWPWYADRLPLLLGAFPTATMIYLVRDPRGLWLSAQEFKGRERGDEILNELLEKDAKVRSVADRDRFITVRYEDLVAHTEEQLTRLASRIGFTPEVPLPSYERHVDPYPDRWGWIPRATSRPDPTVAYRWNGTVPESKIEQIERRADEFMRIYGYPRQSA